MRKFTIYIVLILLVTLSVFVTVSAESTSAEFFDPKDYAIVDYWTDNSGVTYDLYTPSSWYTTGVYRCTADNRWQWLIGHYNGSKFSFDTFLAEDHGISLLMHPLGTSANVGADKGYQIDKGHVIDLTYIPRDTFFQSGFQITINGSDIDISPLNTDVILLFVDENGVVVYRYALTTYQEWTDGDTYMQGYYHFHVDFENINIPQNAVGLVPYYTFTNLDISDVSTISVEYSPFRMGFSMSALELESLQNEKLQDTLENVESAIEEQNKQFDDFVNATVPPNESPIDDSINDLDKAESELTDQTNQGFEQILEIITGAIAEITAYATAFVAISGVLEMFFTLPILGPLIYISLGLGIFALITNLAMSLSRAETAKSKTNAKGGKKG